MSTMSSASPSFEMVDLNPQGNGKSADVVNQPNNEINHPIHIKQKVVAAVYITVMLFCGVATYFGIGVVGDIGLLPYYALVRIFPKYKTISFLGMTLGTKPGMVLSILVGIMGIIPVSLFAATISAAAITGITLQRLLDNGYVDIS